MSATTVAGWTAANQRHLSAALAVVRDQLVCARVGSAASPLAINQATGQCEMPQVNIP